MKKQTPMVFWGFGIGKERGWLVGESRQRKLKSVTLSEAKGLSRFFATLRMTTRVFWDFEIDKEKRVACRRE